jgi:hypothetical protein
MEKLMFTVRLWINGIPGKAVQPQQLNNGRVENAWVSRKIPSEQN